MDIFLLICFFVFLIYDLYLLIYYILQIVEQNIIDKKIKIKNSKIK